MFQEYPRWMYGPGEQSRIFEKDDPIPEGWQDHPSKVEQTKPQAKPRKKAEKPVLENPDAERAALIASIREDGIDIAETATDEEINAALEQLTQEQEQ